MRSTCGVACWRRLTGGGAKRAAPLFQVQRVVDLQGAGTAEQGTPTLDKLTRDMEDAAPASVDAQKTPSIPQSRTVPTSPRRARIGATISRNVSVR